MIGKKKLITDHRTAVTRNVTASGIIEVRGESELLLNDIIIAVYEHNEKHLAEKDESTVLDERLRVMGEEM